MTSSARCQGDADSDVESTAEELEEEQRERNLTMFSKRHLFVELHELKNNEWHETKRYNYGLEEDLATDGPKRHWTKAHLPSISVFGMLAFRDCLHEDLVILDVASQSATGASQLEPVALAIVDHLVSDGAVEAADRDAALLALLGHLNSRKCVEHDDELKAFKREREQRKRRQTLESEVSKLPRAGPLETLGEVDEDGDDDDAKPAASWRRPSLPKLLDVKRPPSVGSLLDLVKKGRGGNDEPASPRPPEPPALGRSRSAPGPPRCAAVGDLEKKRRTKAREDTLKPDAEEEAVHVLIDDDFAWLREDIVAFVRLSEPVDTGLEEHVDVDELDDDESAGGTPQSSPSKGGLAARSKERAPAKPHQQLHARFIVLVLGRREMESARGSSAAKLLHDRHVEMGAAAAAMMQDDSVVRVAYEATAPSQVLAAIDRRLSALRVLPQTSRPTSKAVDRRAKRIMKQLAQLKEEEERKRLEALDAENDLVTGRAVGSVFLRVQYPTQNQKLLAKQRDVFAKGVSLTTFFEFAQKYALPLVAGIVLALVLANARAGGYRRWAGASHGGDDDDGDDGLVDDHGDDHGSSHGGHPTVFGLRVHGHDVTLHFLVNDVLMALFFGLAVKEIAEAFQPGGSLYPPGRKAVNPLCGTLGGVLGPIAAYFAVLYAGDGPAWLGLVLLAMALAYGLRRARCARWEACVALAGPPAWIGLLWASVHPSLALVFVVPFMPLSVGHEEERDELDAVLSESPRGALSDANLKAHDSAMEAGAEPEAHVPVHRSPLHDFEESVKGFVDFGVLFAFGVVNAGVRVDAVGGFTVVICLSLLLGKALGMTLGSNLATVLGFPRPDGMSHRHLVVAGVISSVGLTVSLFIAGEAFTAKPTLEAQAKMGALLSVFPPLVLCGAAVADPRMRDRLLGPDGKKDDDATLEGGSNRSGGTLPTDDDASSAASTAGDPHAVFVNEEDEDLEAVVVSNIESSLLRIQRLEAKIEERVGLSRSASIDQIHEHQSRLRKDRKSFDRGSFDGGDGMDSSARS
ncbi:Na+/H+ antiporter 1 [Aureococcus anophagefferens]|nr:Na+/H+ antiporter 1 [Aureococcus anophagefferens]